MLVLCRPADDCKVHFEAHLHPRFAHDFERELTPSEQLLLLSAVENHGRNNWAAVATDIGLQWPHWRLLQCFNRALCSRNADRVMWDNSLDAKLIKTAVEFSATSNKRRRVSWLVCSICPVSVFYELNSLLSVASCQGIAGSIRCARFTHDGKQQKKCHNAIP